MINTLQNSIYSKGLLALVVVSFTMPMVKAQVGVGTTTPHASAQLEVQATDKGMLVPRMTTSQRNAISSPATGLLVYDNTVDSFFYYNGTAWIGMATNGTSSEFQRFGNVVSNTTDLANDNFVFGSTSLDNITGTTDDDNRFFFNKSKGAFRAGSATGSYWNDDSLGTNSFASGYNTKAIGGYSTAMGANTTASGYSSTAMGSNTTASGNFSTAMGVGTTASGTYSTAMGYYTTASGTYSTAMGRYVSTNTYPGAFIIGDSRITTTTSTAANQMTMRFGGGYRLFTSTTGDGSSVGVTLASNGNSWSSISDSTKKENFKFADGEAFLAKIKSMKLGSWNYKTQDPKKYRHYGPMAQEFYAHFGNDGIGIIGNDTTIATADIDGVMMIAIQQLIKENDALKTQATELKTQATELKSQVTELKTQSAKLQAALSAERSASAAREAEVNERLLQLEALLRKTEIAKKD
mgnify:CR=1 FL=1